MQTFESMTIRCNIVSYDDESCNEKLISFRIYAKTISRDNIMLPCYLGFEKKKSLHYETFINGSELEGSLVHNMFKLRRGQNICTCRR